MGRVTVSWAGYTINVNLVTLRVIVRDDCGFHCQPKDGSRVTASLVPSPSLRGPEGLRPRGCGKG